MPLVKNPEDLDINYIVELYHQKFFDEIIPKSKASRRYEDLKLSDDGETIILVDKYQKDLISVVTGEFINVKRTIYFEIKGTYSKNPRKGDLTYLFEILIYELNYNIISDKEHSSPGSKEFWKALIRRDKFSIYRIDIKTNYKRLANSYKDEDIWQNYSHTIDNIYLDDFEDYIIDNKFNVLDINELLEKNDEFINDELKIKKTKKTNNTIIYENIRLVAEKIRRLK